MSEYGSPVRAVMAIEDRPPPVVYRSKLSGSANPKPVSRPVPAPTPHR